MRRNIIKTVALGIGLLTITAASAQDAPEVKEKKAKFGKMDVNKDAKIDLEEYSKFRAAMRAKKGKEPIKGDYSKRFNEIDTNGDGTLSKEEFKIRKETRKPKVKKAK